jgi:hypothetical protein
MINNSSLVATSNEAMVSMGIMTHVVVIRGTMVVTTTIRNTASKRANICSMAVINMGPRSMCVVCEGRSYSAQLLEEVPEELSWSREVVRSGHGILWHGHKLV